MLGQLDNLNQNTLDDCTMVLGATASIVGDGKAVDSTGKTSRSRGLIWPFRVFR